MNKLFNHLHNKIGKSQNLAQLNDEIRLKNVLDKVEALILNREIHSIKTVLYIIKIYTDRYVSNRSANLLEADNIPYNKPNPILFSVMQNYETKDIFKIHLGKVPILTNPFDSKKLRIAIQKYGDPYCSWKYNKDGHLFGLFAPLGITAITDNGNHSVTAGLIKSQGTLYASKENIYDISYCYEKYIYRDGWFWKVQQCQNQALSPCYEAPFDFAVLFEIGRLLIKHRINLVEYFPRV